MAFGDIVQSVAAGDPTTTLGAVPTVGNTLLWVWGGRSTSVGTSHSPTTGTWALLRREFCNSNVTGDGATALYLKPVELGDTTAWASHVISSGDKAFLYEIEGLLTADDDAGASSVYGVDPTVVLTPTAGLPAVLVSLANFFTDGLGGFPAWATPAAGMTELRDTGAPAPCLALNIQVVALTTGSYTVGSTGSINGLGSYAAIVAVALVGTPPPPGPGTGFDVFDPGDVFLATLDDSTRKSIRDDLNGTGTGQLTIRRDSPNATAAILRGGNLVKVRIPRIDTGYIFGFFLENPEVVLAAAEEKGAEEATIIGRGALAYLERAIWLAESFVVPWWPATMGTPPAGARGAVIVKAGRYRHYNIAGGVIDGMDVDGDGFSWFTTAGFSAYWDTNKKYDWPDENSQRYLVHLVTTEDPGSPDYTGFYFHPNQDGVKNYPKAVTPGTINDTIPLTDIGDGDKPGQVLYRIYQEAVDVDRPIHPVPNLTVDFTDTEDSNGDPWTTTDALKGVTAELGETYLTTLGKLLGTGVLDVAMSPDLVLSAYNHYGRDLAGDDFGPGVVRFVKGVNIADKVARSLNPAPVATWAEVLGTDSQLAHAVNPGAAGMIPRETSVRGETNDPAALEALGLAELERQATQSDSTAFKTTTNEDDEDVGHYLPGPAGTVHGKYWVGDDVRFHTGSDEHDFDEVDRRVAAITIAEDEAANLEVTVELNSAYGGHFGRGPGGREWRGGATGATNPNGLIRTAGGARPGLSPTVLTSSSDTSSSEPRDVTAAEVSIADAGGHFAAANVEGALAEIPKVRVTTTDPTTGDDSGDGYAVGSRWINVTSAEEFVATDVTVGAAVWVSTTVASAGDILDLPTAETDTTLVLAPDGGGGVEFRAETGGGGGSLTTVDQDISADFVTGSGSTWADVTGLTGISVPAGTWIVTVDLETSAGAAYGPVYRITDGTTIYAQSGILHPNITSAASAHDHFASKPFVLAATATMKLQYFSDTAHTVKKYPSRGGVTSVVATRVSFLEIA